MYMRYTQGQNDEYYQVCVLNQVLTKQNSAPTAMHNKGGLFCAYYTGDSELSCSSIRKISVGSGHSYT